jgi:ATP-binding cassette subfamily F protein 3
MSLVVLDGVHLGFGRKTILQDLGLRIGERDRIGLCGPNGSGKTTLLRILAGEQGVDAGKVLRARGVRVGWLPQDLVLEGGRALMSLVMGSVPGREELDRELERATRRLAAADRTAGESTEPAAADELMEAAERVAELHDRAAHFDTFFSEHEAATILAGLGFSTRDHERDVAELSGGWKMRAVLAALLFQRPDLLLLDEPTNHLDLPSVAWFADFLRRTSRAFVLICHDREFLDEQIDRVVSFESEGVRQYKGNYESYRRQRAEEEIVLRNKARNLEREREKAEQFIDRFRAQANKARAVQSRIKALDRMAPVETFESRRAMSFSFPACERAGSEVVRLERVAKRFGEHVVFDGVDLVVRRGEKVGIVGVNGSGKTTLLKLVAGELTPDRGNVRLGHQVRAGYYAQHHVETLRRESTVFDEVAAQDRSAGQTRVRAILGAFLFSGDDVEKRISVLSGGERSRVALARLLIKPGNLLLMDEPTNHLDLESSEALAASLATYDGTLVFVSHNRSFVGRLATTIWNVAERSVEVYPGTLADYRHTQQQRGESPATEVAPPPVPARPRSVAPTPQRDRQGERTRRRDEARRRTERSRRVGPLAGRVAEIEGRIAQLEREQRERSTALADPAVYEDSDRRAELLSGYQRAAIELERLSAAWEVAQAELEEARGESD